MTDPAAPEKARPISLRLDAEILSAIDAALQDGEDRTTWIRGAIHSALNPVTVEIDTHEGGGQGAPLPTILGGRKVPPLARSTRSRLRR